MATSTIKANVTHINVSNATSIKEIFDAFEATTGYSYLSNGYSVAVYGDIGHLDSPNLQTLLGNPQLGNYASVRFIPVDAHGSARMAVVYATSKSNIDSSMKRKYIWMCGVNEDRQMQSAWETITAAT